MEDAFNLGVMPRAAVQKWANELYPDIAQLFPFQGVVRFKAHFGNGIAVAITDEGMPGTIFAGGQVQADDPEIAEVLRVFASDSAPTFSQMYAVLGDKYFNFTRFTYAGPYRGGDSGYEVYAAFLADWVESCVLPRVLELNRSRVMRAISSNRLMQMSKTLQYDIAISFAGEDRVLAESIAGELKNRSVRVFYDEFEKATLWGKDLFQHLRTVYRDKARFCIILVSAHYGAKHWTRHELKNAQERAFLQDEEYILPVRIDDTELPGMNSTTGYLDARNNSVDQIVDLAIQKLAIGKVATNAVELPQGPIKGPSNHRVAPSTTVNDPSSSFTSIESTVFFADRFAQAFPGVRGIAWFGSADDVQQRLEKLLELPLAYGGNVPIWWLSGVGNLQIERFASLGSRAYLMNVEELLINSIAAVSGPSYFHNFVYVKCDPISPIGIYPDPAENIQEAVAQGRTYSEEYAVLDSGKVVSRAEFDDGAATIDGRLVDIRGKAQLRVRHLTPYSFVIAANGSPINNGSFDERLERHLRSIASDPKNLSALADDVFRLPRGRR